MNFEYSEPIPRKFCEGERIVTSRMLVERSEKSTKITKLIWGKEENWRPTREKFIACDFRGGTMA